MKPNFQFFNNRYYSISHNDINLDFNITEQSNNLSLFEKRIIINFNTLNDKFFECELITIDYIIVIRIKNVKISISSGDIVFTSKKDRMFFNGHTIPRVKC